MQIEIKNISENVKSERIIFIFAILLQPPFRTVTTGRPVKTIIIILNEFVHQRLRLPLFNSKNHDDEWRKIKFIVCHFPVCSHMKIEFEWRRWLQFSNSPTPLLAVGLVVVGVRMCLCGCLWNDKGYFGESFPGINWEEIFPPQFHTKESRKTMKFTITKWQTCNLFPSSFHFAHNSCLFSVGLRVSHTRPFLSLTSIFHKIEWSIRGKYDTKETKRNWDENQQKCQRAHLKWLLGEGWGMNRTKFKMKKSINFLTFRPDCISGNGFVIPHSEYEHSFSLFLSNFVALRWDFLPL